MCDVCVTRVCVDICVNILNISSYIYIFICYYYVVDIYILLFYHYRVLMVDIFIIFLVQITHFGGNSDIFITFRVHQVQIKKVTLNRNKNRGGVPGCPEG